MGDEQHECPTCGEFFDTETGCSVHHKMAHGKSIAGTEVKCEYCGSIKTVDKDVARKNDVHFCDIDCKADFQHEEWSGEDHPAYDREEIICEYCGETEMVKPYRAEVQKYCSKECQIEHFSEMMSGEGNYFWEGGQVDVQCEQCGDAYLVDPCDADETIFCSKECQSKWRSHNWRGEDSPNWNGGTVTLVCQYCGRDFEALQATSDERKYCSRQCAQEELSRLVPSGEDHPLWNGGDPVYGEGWTELKRRMVRIRDQARCQHCGRTEPEHIEEFGAKHTVHHITPARQIDDPEERNAMKNLITLCRGECHHSWEQMAPLRPDHADIAGD